MSEYIREKQLRDRVRAAKMSMEILTDLGKPKTNGEFAWAEMYVEDVSALRRLLADIVIKNAAVALGGDRTLTRDAIRKAQKFLGAKAR